ncbi:alpha/beta hydrolase [Roseobacter denitrificans]|uniref:Haloacetate dehalogenase H-1, putative n=1 Tax=Roseobacter denitrificans (strain ATCC 33942 / OCh 114) TaxID=375451 RepID=Q165I6_ROSDO|nr:alpha/beta hydrolase [Roseobacter denitrificans]ABG32357.1 haloacetate dehalogenase H-1, putative [Roseobacter denitrificans OCh 114]AVL51834.1 alpha/beta hydrolase [Roseobacter denitrificans]SFF80772.1 haloacetate dehalogenase [Roseobacter denitrificans OCh 114]
MFAGFEVGDALVNGQSVHYRAGGQGAPVLLLHGFPQTHVMWHAVATRLAKNFSVVASDLRGYGHSSKPTGTEAYSFRNMASDQIALMHALGHDRFHVVGHDRGGRVAHRMALDHPKAIQSLTVMDIVPTHLLLDDLSKEVAEAYYHWFFLAQPAPFPETMIGHDPDAFFERCLLGFGAAQLSDFDADALEAYRAAWRNPETIRAMCADYRAALHVDFTHDSQDHGRRIDVPALVLFGAEGAMAQSYNVADTWREKLSQMKALAIPGGHFFIDQSPDETHHVLETFLSEIT